MTLKSLALASPEEPSVLDIVAHIASDQKAIVTSPGRMDRNDAAVWGATGLSMIVLMPNFDGSRSLGERLAGGIDREDGPYRELFRDLTLLGDGRVLFGASLATYSLASVLDESSIQSRSARWIEALVDSTIWVTAVKMVAGRNRPGGRKPESEFAGPGGYFKDQGVNSSFPSGHTTLAFATAAVWTRESGNNPWIGVPLYLTAGAVGFSRIYVEKHWLSDVLVGAALGHSIGTLVENRRGPLAKKSTSRIQPTLGENHAGFAWVYEW